MSKIGRMQRRSPCVRPIFDFFPPSLAGRGIKGGWEYILILLNLRPNLGVSSLPGEGKRAVPPRGLVGIPMD